ncbi:MAG TPA: hypothetical protein VG649_07160 [Candidatus Angelobacter sp.]|jgi:hypothetical protein|nr:hypothetical protein [Candidatus Angelobacter sp.]
MQFSEEDLRRALRRKTPSPDFTQRVLARIEQVEGENKSARPKLAPTRHSIFSLRFWPARIAAFAAMLVVAVGLVQYDRYETHIRQETAKKQALLGIEITSATLNQALHRALVRTERPE